MTLAFALLVPALAAPNPDYVPNFTQQPAKSLLVALGENIKLNVKAELPKESDGSPLRYQWTLWQTSLMAMDFLPVEGAKNASLTLPSAGLLIENNTTLYLRCEVTAKLKNGETALVKSDVCQVFVYRSFAGAVAELKKTWKDARADHNVFVASAQVAGRAFSLAMTPVHFVVDWLRYQFKLRKSFHRTF